MSARVRIFGALAALEASDRELLLSRSLSVAGDAVSDAVRTLVEEVRREGDQALRRQAARFDGVALESLEVPRSAWVEALERQPRALVDALERAARNIRAVHAAQRPSECVVDVEPGLRVGRRPDPLERVGVYAPGGRAAYPSSVLMGAVPARVAGVGEVILCSPPGPNGRPTDVVLAAAAIAGVDRVFALGGAGAVAAMAFGTGSVPRVDRIVGPGNAYVAEAKRQLQGVVGIDSPAGPSELLVVAAAAASPRAIAAELLAQAEHDPNACVVALVEGAPLAAAVQESLTVQLGALERRDVIEQALSSRGAILWVSEVAEAWPFANAFAPEHLLLLTRAPAEDLARVRNAGSVFLGEFASVAFGDYLSGANHVLPTAGTARVFSGLSVQDFFRWTTWQSVDADAAGGMAQATDLLATSEGLPAHAAAARRAGGDA